jgi:hypothetical protein
MFWAMPLIDHFLHQIFVIVELKPKRFLVRVIEPLGKIFLRTRCKECPPGGRWAKLRVRLRGKTLLSGVLGLL